MALVNVVNMVVLDNPTSFLNPFQFEITFECLQELDDDLEWKVIYVGSAHDSHKDQVLDEILVGPVPVGLNKFVLQAEAPNPTLLPPEEILGVTVVLVTCSYKEREFVRVGYYVNNEYMDPLAVGAETTSTAGINGVGLTTEGKAGETTNSAEEEVSSTPFLNKPFDLNLLPSVQRQILADKPRVTKFPIPWGKETTITTTAVLGSATMSTDLEKMPAGMGTPETVQTDGMEVE